jgi:Amt family ammonium transporter
LLASKAVNADVVLEGFFVGGSVKLLIANLVSVCSVALYSVIMTYIIMKFVNIFVNIRVSETIEKAGLDQSIHGESAR